MRAVKEPQRSEFDKFSRIIFAVADANFPRLMGNARDCQRMAEENSLADSS
jgi:hypothetical protein